MPPVRPIKVALVGLGRSGYDIHIARVRDEDRFRVTAVTDWLPERMREANDALGCAMYPDHRALLREADAEVVVVATYSDTHPAITRDALRSGRHVICEKPIANSSHAARSMIRAAQQAGRLLFAHHNYRFFPETQHLLEVTNSRRIGEVFEAQMRSFDFFRRNDWQTLREYAGGVLNNTCTHFLDIGLLLLGAPVATVFCDLKLISDVGDAEDHVRVILRGTNGRIFDLQVSTSCKMPQDAQPPKWMLMGTEGTLISDGRTSRISWFDPDALGALEVTRDPLPGRVYGNADVIPWQSEDVPSIGPTTGDFYDNVWAVLREDAEMVVSPQHALAVVRVIEQCKAASGFTRAWRSEPPPTYPRG